MGWPCARSNGGAPVAREECFGARPFDRRPQICPRNPELQMLGGQGEGWPGALGSPCHTLFLFSRYAAGPCVSDPSRTGCRWPVCPRPRPVPLAFGEPNPALPTPSCLLQESCLLGSAGLGLYFTDGETEAPERRSEPFLMGKLHTGSSDGPRGRCPGGQSAARKADRQTALPALP